MQQGKSNVIRYPIKKLKVWNKFKNFVLYCGSFRVCCYRIIVCMNSAFNLLLVLVNIIIPVVFLDMCFLWTMPITTKVSS